MKKIYMIIFISTIIFLFGGCGNTKAEQEYLEWESKQQVEYEYEEVDALIRDIDVRYEPIHDCYRWSISIYCISYDLYYSEGMSGGNQFNPPSFIDKVKGDNCTVEICNKYINGDLVERHVTQIK